ncbi:hypothetical protein E2C01_022420 [Portunus trituberculatus]|uniref:Uncharacterized protein n=1 Tax=Portunus trituberculatus TaxID=210409 RepID=A0A5B7E5B3_PORTR|nr:hypothetical protein [Portunus trituberculatus]
MEARNTEFTRMFIHCHLHFLSCLGKVRDVVWLFITITTTTTTTTITNPTTSRLQPYITPATPTPTPTEVEFFNIEISRESVVDDIGIGISCSTSFHIDFDLKVHALYRQVIIFPAACAKSGQDNLYLPTDQTNITYTSTAGWRRVSAWPSC